MIEQHSKRPLVYVASPYAGDVETNISNAQKYCRFAISQGCIPLAPHLLYPQFLDDTEKDERKLGIEFALSLLEKCDEMWVFGDRISNGMGAEIERAEKLGLPIKRFNAECVEIVSQIKLPPESYVQDGKVGYLT